MPRVWTSSATPKKHKAPKLNKLYQAKLKEELKLYLTLRDRMASLNCIGGGWTSQLAWGSDLTGTPMACADIAEALFNSTFDHRGKKAAIPFATENDLQGLLTMVCYAALTGGEPILFADYRKVYEPWEIQKKADELGIELDPNADYMQRGTIDMDNSGSGSLDWADESPLRGFPSLLPWRWLLHRLHQSRRHRMPSRSPRLLRSHRYLHHDPRRSQIGGATWTHRRGLLPRLQL